MSQNGPWSSGQGLDNVNIQLLSFLCNFVTKSVCPTPIKMPLSTLWSMGLTEGVIQRVDMSLSTNKLACVLASIIGVPCNVPLPRAVLCVPMAILNEGSQGFNGTPVSFKQTQGDPLLFSMLHWTAGSPRASRLGAGIPHRGPRPSAHSPIVPLMTSSQESGVNSLFTLLAAISALYFSVAWLQGVGPEEKWRGNMSCSSRTWLARNSLQPCSYWTKLWNEPKHLQSFASFSIYLTPAHTCHWGFTSLFTGMISVLWQ